MRIAKLFSLLVIACWGGIPAQAAERRDISPDVLRLLKAQCVKCHGPAKREGELNLSSPVGLARGGESGLAVIPGNLNESLLWERIESDEMPPEKPLSAQEKTMIRDWISGGAIGLPKDVPELTNGTDHWAYQKLTPPDPPAVKNGSQLRTPVDRFIQSGLKSRQLRPSAEADRATLIRRLSFTTTGLPPTPDEIAGFLADSSPKAYENLVEHYLASPRYGERWGKFWLDAAGYADSNGYFGADTDRPLAYRYRDYVIRSLNSDKPFDQFVREQLAGDELSGFVPGKTATPDVIELLTATHYLRNGQDGTDSSDGNPDELRVDRYAALESAMQIVGSSLLGLTVQCSKCHDHKFEPFTQQDYYQLQAVFYPIFPAQSTEQWVKPRQRFVHANLPGELEKWETENQKLEAEVTAMRQELAQWISKNRPAGKILFQDDFNAATPLATNWSNTAPGDDGPGGKVPVHIDSEQAPAAFRKAGNLQVIEGGTQGDSWISTKESFDWTPESEGEWIQATFDLIDNKLPPSGTPAARIAFLIALHDFNDNSQTTGGNILLDGNPAGGAGVHVDYPGSDSKTRGKIGKTGYLPGHNYGVRITNVGDGKFWLEQLVDWLPDGEKITLSAADLPQGGFGFEYCCGRSFVVDNVVIEASPANGSDSDKEIAKTFHESYKARHKQLDDSVKSLNARKANQPGKIAWASDLSVAPPDVFLLTRGVYSLLDKKVKPAPLSVFAGADETIDVALPFTGAKSSGQRLAWANWLTRKDSRQAALMARVQVNRLWQKTFGTGIVATPGNLGVSGATPSHPDLLEWLAGEFIRSGWRMKQVHRVLLNSWTFRQAGAMQETAYQTDPEDRLLWRFPLRRLDAEAIRDATIAVSGQLDLTMGGPYVATSRGGAGEVTVSSKSGASRRSVYLYSRRTQIHSVLNVFDAPSIVYNCTRRLPSTTPLQSLSLLNSTFAVQAAQKFAARLEKEAGNDPPKKIQHAYLLALGKTPSPAEIASAGEFIETQMTEYRGRPSAESDAWADFCQMLLSSNAFLYVE